MKTRFTLMLAVCAALAAFTTTACKDNSTSPPVVATPTPAATPSVQAAIDDLPSDFKAKVKAAVAKVVSVKNLNSLANGIESLAARGAALPSPASLQNGVLPWVEMLPDVGPVATDVFLAYSAAYPYFKPTAETLTAIGEFIRSLEPLASTAFQSPPLAGFPTLLAVCDLPTNRRYD